MFKHIFLLVAVYAVLGFAEPLQVYDRQGREFYLIPATDLHSVRQRREVRIPTDHNIRGKAYGYQDSKYGEVYGARGIYTHRPSESQVKVAGETRQFGGSKVAAQGNYNFFRTDDGRGTIGVGGKYTRKSDGFGHNRNDYAAILEGEYRFG
ncbi:PREDICTED: uncharacterized protein LOC108567301 [Nicrophorus vespilloides]|uniref:Uncharacterized protein LOC108567301 n=1 Tax=Nicrophorus vespilloides TaxID=110193 RepID=A0ABM1N8L2_NICVS|nr:PREDICTED: uncharacterized protein LOC108567301 [Nicrophorus vespilloides]